MMKTHNMIYAALGLAVMLSATAAEANATGSESANTKTSVTVLASIPLDAQNFSQGASSSNNAAAGSFLANTPAVVSGLSEGRGTQFPGAGGIFGGHEGGHFHHFHEDHEVVNAIPEPGTFALFLAGLGLIGWSLRRHRHD